ncbi:MAG: DUF1638 domain-containing protein [Syntrophorhabdales bacterium]|jgi:hypothetical protein
MPVVLIACKVLEKEIVHSLPPDADVEVLWLDAGLHASLPRLEEALKGALDRAKPSERKTCLLYGQGCHPEIEPLLEDLGAAAFPVKNCIEALLGKEAPEIKDTKTMIMTPGWVRAWPSMMEALGWNEVDARINLGRYERILVIDAGLDPLTDEETLWFFDLVQVSLEIRKIDLAAFRDLLSHLLDDTRAA